MLTDRLKSMKKASKCQRFKDVESFEKSDQGKEV